MCRIRTAKNPKIRLILQTCQGFFGEVLSAMADGSYRKGLLFGLVVGLEAHNALKKKTPNPYSRTHLTPKVPLPVTNKSNFGPDYMFFVVCQIH